MNSNPSSQFFTQNILKELAIYPKEWYICSVIEQLVDKARTCCGRREYLSIIQPFHAMPMKKISLKLMEHESDLNLLSQVQKTLNQNPDANQRELATSANLSLGMTNALLRRFTDKGWLYMKKISTRNIQYVLTPEGLNELAHRSSRYFKRTARLMKDYRDCITKLIANALTEGCKEVLLVGETDLAFLFDFACTDAHISLYKTTIIPSIVTTTTLIVFIDKECYDKALLIHSYTTNFVCISEVLRVHEVENQEMLCQSI